MRVSVFLWLDTARARARFVYGFLNVHKYQIKRILHLSKVNFKLLTFLFGTSETRTIQFKGNNINVLISHFIVLINATFVNCYYKEAMQHFSAVTTMNICGLLLQTSIIKRWIFFSFFFIRNNNLILSWNCFLQYSFHCNFNALQWK